MRDNRSFAALIRPLAAAPLLVLLAACRRDVLDPAGDIAVQQRNLIYTSTGLMLLVIIPVLVLIVVFAWRYRQSNKDATYDPAFHHSTSLELVIWAVPLLIIIALGAVTWSSTHLLDPFRPLDRVSASKPLNPAARTLQVQVVSMDWKWLFIYPEQGIATVNELVLPVDRPVRFEITSTNMMNTFYAPTLAGMIYAMPGMQGTLHAVLNRPGEFEGFSANYSGAGFSDMKFKLRGVDEASFARWAADVKAQGRPLDLGAYQALEQPSEKVPAMAFGSVMPSLFDKVVNRCVKPGVACMREVMAADRAKDGKAPSQSMPMDHGSMPAEPPPKGAVFKSPQEIAPGRNVTDPKAAQPPGHTTPASPHNRNMSFLPPRPAQAVRGEG